jgi:uncharacterized protein YyaL (SSP411 family)/cytochrome c biogenesis protein CcdA
VLRAARIARPPLAFLFAALTLLSATPLRANHLAGATSPYLQEHAGNPVDWYPWGDEALQKARREDRPIFLSIGYSSCHWCHVMAAESFSDPGIAALLNASFVAIKVDREERPDLDTVYMNAVLVSAGSGGWPMSVFLTPDLRPFQGGTYYPRDRFAALLRSVASAWKERRADVLSAAEALSHAVADLQTVPQGNGADERDADLIVPAVTAVEKTYDTAHGGFGGAPKFPPHGALALLMRAGHAGADPGALEMAVDTLAAMSRGGLYDQIGGGFHRYATDAAWRKPHFEKMLYDNALLVPLYLMAWKESGRDELREVAESTLSWVTRDMTDSRGGFLSAIDADSEGEEGRYYTWTLDEIGKAVGPSDAPRIESYYGATAKGDLPGGRNVLHVASPDAVFAVREGMSLPGWRAALATARGKMLAARAARPRPRRDDKVLTAWNGLMISAFSVAHRATGKPEYLTTARKAARFALDHLRDREGHPLVSWRDGAPGGPGFLDDSAFLIRGLLDLQAADHDPAWLEAAGSLARDATRFADPAGGWFFATDRKDLIARPLVLNDQAMPSGNAVMVENLARISRLTGDLGSLSAARRAVERAATVMRTAPASYPYMILARDTLDAAVAAASKPAATGELATAAAAAAPARTPPAATTTPRSVPGVLVGRGSKERVVDTQLQQPAEATRPGGAVEIPVVLDIHGGWHVNSSKPTLDYLIPTRLQFTPGPAFTVEGVDYPDGAMVKLQFAEEPLSVYENRVTLRARLRVDPKTAPGSIDAVARLSYQACSEKACLAPETVEFRAALVVAGEPIAAPGSAPAAGPAPSAATTAPGGSAVAPSATRIEGQDQLSVLLRQRGLLFVMGVVFLGGLALTLTPCVYPMIPVTLGFFSQQASSAGWGRRVALPALYVLGMALTYSVLGVIAGSTGGLFGAALQSPILVGGMILLFVAMALWMFGLFELSLPGALTRLGTGRAGALGALLMGLTLGLVAAPCIGPFIVTLLAFVGASGSAWLGFWLFFVLALGMGLPFLVLGTFSGMLATLPRSGVWLIYAKKVMGVGLLAVALYFMQPFLADHVLGWSAILFAVVAGVYLAWLEKTRMRAAWFLPLRLVIGALVVTGGFWLALPLVRARVQPRWQPYADDAVTRAGSDGRPVLIDFFAVWCAPCRELDRSTYSDPRVLEELGRFALLKADLTNAESPSVQALRDRYAVYGVPTVVLLDRQGKDRQDLRLTGFEPAEAFLERLRRIP